MGVVWFPQFDKVLGIRESDGALCLSGDVVLTPGNVTSILANTGDALLDSANVFTRGQTFTLGTANEALFSSTGYSVTGANTTSLISAAGTWNTSGAPTLLLFNLTNTASGGTPKFLDYKVGGTTLLDILADGNLRASKLTVLVNGFLDLNANTGTSVLTAGDGTATIAQRSGTTAQTFSLYDTYTSATDYHRLSIKTARATLASVSGASVTATGLIPDGAVVVGVTTKVTVALGTGSGTTGYTIGDGSDVDRWGAIVGTAAGTSSDNTNWTATTVQAFTSAQDVVITASGGNFNGTGTIYVAVQYLIGQCD